MPLKGSIAKGDIVTLVVISIRAPEELRDELAALAAARGMSLSEYGALMLQEGAARPPQRGDGPLVDTVAVLFADIDGPGVPLEREAALRLARTAEAGGSAGVTAVRELLALVDRSLGERAQANDMITQLRARRAERRAADVAGDLAG